MKQKITQWLIGLSLIATVLTYQGCKKDKNADLNIIGKWAKTIQQQTTLYTFNSDATFELDVYESDSTSGSITGYRYKSIGKYTLNNAALTLSFIQNYTNPDGIFGAKANLVATAGTTIATYTVTLTNQNNQLNFFFNCPINADCVASPIVYYRTF